MTTLAIPPFPLLDGHDVVLRHLLVVEDTLLPILMYDDA